MTARRVVIGGLVGIAFAVAVGSLHSPAASQTPRPEAAAKTVYERIPDLPLANTYTRSDTGALDPDNTLIARFIRYHQDVKKRFTEIRLDWRLTLADYLGANDPIVTDRYPGANTLTANPMTRDIELIRSLNRRQRDALVTILVSIYNPEPTTPPTPAITPSPSPIPESPRRGPALSRPGDANLLK